MEPALTLRLHLDNSERQYRGPYVLRDFFLGFIRIHILHHAAEEPVYGAAIMQELARHGYDLSPGTLYPVLHSLEQAGYLHRADRLVGGKIRKYYSITEEGLRVLEEAKEKIHELVYEVLQGHGPVAGEAPSSSTTKGAADNEAT